MSCGSIVATLRMVTELERMGDLAAHVAKIAAAALSGDRCSEALRPNFVRMGDVAEKMVITAGPDAERPQHPDARRSCGRATRRWTTCGVPSSE